MKFPVFEVPEMLILEVGAISESWVNTLCFGRGGLGAGRG